MKGKSEFEFIGMNTSFGNYLSSSEPWSEVFDPSCCLLLKNTKVFISVLWVGSDM